MKLNVSARIHFYSIDCECCGKATPNTPDDLRKYEGYLVCAHCRITRADELSARRAKEDAELLS